MSEHQWPTFKDGDRVWSVLAGQWGTVHVDPVSKMRVVDGWVYDEYGRFSGEKSFPVLFHNEIKPEGWPQPPAPLPDLPVDAPIIVGKRFKRHFAGWGEDGKVLCWEYGQTSFTTKQTGVWDEWRLPTDEELSK